jgi:hypothetical protein
MVENTQNLLSKLQQLQKQKRSNIFYAERLGVTVDKIDDLLRQIKGKVKKVDEQTKEVNIEKGEIRSSIEVTFEPKEIDELYILHKVDSKLYKITNYWSKLKANGKFTSSILASLKKSQDYSPADFAKFLDNWKPDVNYIGYSLGNDRHKQDVFVELNIADFHLAKKTINEDTLKTKEFDYHYVLTELIRNIRANYKIKRLVFPISNDFFHTDNYQNTTTNGTSQDVTVWYDEEYEKGFSILVSTISFLLEQSESVEVVLVQGNHDRTKGFFVAHALETYFKDIPQSQLKFQRHHSTTKSVVLGNTFIGYHHGNSCKIDELPLLFATVPEFSKAFGNAKFREIHTADKHHYMAKDIKGVRIQQLPSLSGDDRWHIDNNFINSVRAGLAFVYHPEKGKIAEFESRV